jgi:hypothetical protein
MRFRFAALLGTFAWLALSAHPSHAANGVAAITWDSCTGPVQKTASAPGVYSLYVSVLGIDVPHKAYDVRVLYGDANQQVPDAWRFDAEGCQGGSFLLIEPRPHAVAGSKVCPAFMDESTPSLQIKDLRFVTPFEPYANTLLRLTLLNSYPNGVATVDPLTRYLLARFEFDHMYSVEGAGTPGLTCGGFESGVCFKLTRANYLTMDGVETDFDRPGFALQTATFNDIQLTQCVANPVRPATWGQIKNQYRN